MTCPACGSSEITRIGLYLYQCDDCGDTFDVSEGGGSTNDLFPDDDGFDDEDDDDDD